jgi:4-cresol dehydrogenase (hydroxylating) flavoprotein subunit
MTESDDDTLSPEFIKANTEIVDITADPGWLAAARWEVAVGYSRLVNPEHKVRMREIYAAICQDGYERKDRSRTIAALTLDGETGTREISALVRVVFGRSDDRPEALLPLDAMHFVRPRADWPHRERGWPEESASEWGRFVIVDKFRTPRLKEQGLDAFLTGLLCRRAMEMCRARGVKLTYAIMPAPVADLVCRSGYPVREIPASLRDDDEGALRLFERFSVYWRHMVPRLYEIRESESRRLSPFTASLPSHIVIADPETVEKRYLRNVTALQRHVPLVVRPRHDGEVAQVVDAANRHGVPLYPFSTGKNWGLGSKLPVVDDCVLVDLSGMNRIVEVDESLAYAILEPGVTQLQLARHLADHHPSLTLNFTGSFAFTGIVGNVLERGDGAHARVDDLLGVRGTLGSGQPFEAGGFWTARPGHPTHASRYVAGPDLCGLFCQSNFGIVTEMAFRLIRKPEARYLLWGSARDDGLEGLVDCIDHFAAQGAINRGSINIGYANRFVQARRTLSVAGGAGDEVAEDWNFYILIGGTARATGVLAAEVIEALEPVCVASGAFRIGRRAGDHDDPAKLPLFLQPLVSPLLGMPDDQSLRGIYQLTGTALPADAAEMDADQTPFGMKCYIPVVPPTSEHVRQAARIVAEVRQQHGLNVKASFFGDGRTLITIHFLSNDPEQVKQAVACEQSMWRRMMAAGYAPYRASIDQMDRLFESRPDFFELVAQLKSVLDPHGIIAPGRYSPPPKANERPTRSV